MSNLAWLLPLIPFVAAGIGLLSNRLPGGPAVPAIAGSAAALVVACLVFAHWIHTGVAELHASPWTPLGGVELRIGTLVDGLSATVALMVTVVALLVQIYSTSYMAGDPRYGTYAAEVSLFTAAMLLVVVASDLFELLIGWEVMGLCSYLLVGHYWQTEGSRSAAVKAFVTTRIGDTGFLIDIFVLGVGAGSFEISRVNYLALPGGWFGSPPAYLSHSTAVAGALLLLMGVVGKSAQFPLHVWLPDAMAGPTPISALIHAATMVAAGIFVVARVYPVYLAAPVALTVLGIIACITMLGAALAALAQDDLKRVLAWSTCSQLAYMAAGLSVRGWTAGVYALIAHAAFKALLFLAAGSVLHAVGTNLMSEMGGLRRKMPVTFVAMLVGGLSLAGIPPFAGAFGKDGVLEAAKEYGGPLGKSVYVVGLVTAVVTAAYITRLILRTFFGDYRGTAVAHESPSAMRIPLVVLSLAVLAVGGPALSNRYGVARWLTGNGDTLPLHLTWSGGILTAGLALVGIGAVVLLHRRAPAEDPVRVLGTVAGAWFVNAFYLDHLYDIAVVRPTKRLARAVLHVDGRGIAATVTGVGRGAKLSGGGLRLLQTGNVQLYATGLVVSVLAAVLVIAAAVAR